MPYPATDLLPSPSLLPGGILRWLITVEDNWLPDTDTRWGAATDTRWLATAESRWRMTNTLLAPVDIITTDYVATSSDRTLLVDATAGDVTVTLPSAANEGQFILVIQTSTANAVTVEAAGSDVVRREQVDFDEITLDPDAGSGFLACGDGVWRVANAWFE